MEESICGGTVNKRSQRYKRKICRIKGLSYVNPKGQIIGERKTGPDCQ